MKRGVDDGHGDVHGVVSFQSSYSHGFGGGGGSTSDSGTGTGTDDGDVLSGGVDPGGGTPSGT